MSLNHLSDVSKPTLYLNPNVNNILAQGKLGVGTNGLINVGALHAKSSQTASPNILDSDLKTCYLQDANGAPFNGGSVVFGTQQGYFAGIKGNLTDGGNNTKGFLSFCARVNINDNFLTSHIVMQDDGKVAIGQPVSGQSNQKLTVKDGIMINDGATNADIFFNSSNHYIQREVATNNLNHFTTGGAHKFRTTANGVDDDIIRVYKNSTTDVFRFSTSNSATCLIAGGQWVDASDKRIKKDIRNIDKNEAYNILDKLEPRNYYFIENNQKQYGFIAQELEETLPDSVFKSYNYIPNLLCKALLKNSILTFEEDKDLKVNDKIRCNDKIFKVLEVLDAKNYLIDYKDENNEEQEVECYGIEVEDFKAVGLKELVTVSIACIKELKKENEELRKANELQDERLKKLEAKFIL